MDNKAGYSLHWACDVVARFEAKHARASEFYKSVFQINSRNLASFLAHRDHFWEDFKQMCKTVERLHPDGNYGSTVRIQAANISALRQRKEPTNYDRRLLTRLEKISKLIELGEKQGMCPKASGIPRPAGRMASFSSSHFPGSEHQLLLEFEGNG